MCWSSHHHSYRDWSREERTEDPTVYVADPVTTPGDLRVSDAERHAVIDLLRRHVGDGRLTLVEFETRIDEVMAARTGAELRAVLRDLPRLLDPEATRRAQARRRSAQFAWFPPLLMLLGVLTIISLVTGVVVLWPLFIFMFFRFGHRRRRYLRAA